MERRLVVNADDFGFTREVNEGILDCHREGILTATTLMATGRAFRHAVDLAKANPTLDVGCHLVLVQAEGLPRHLPALLFALLARRLNPLAIVRTQIEQILKAGLRPTHLDTHKHTHLLRPVLAAVLRASAEYGIPWVRKPADFALDSTASLGAQSTVRMMRRALHSFDRKLVAANARRTDSFAGFQLTGRLTKVTLEPVLRALPPGTTELMCHPGISGPELASARTRLKQSRIAEWDTLRSPAIRSVLLDERIRLVSYRDL